ncbi:MAG: mechanosensitive ion channel domain-containing protein [Candidatus Helarchaeota archaeon]
MNFVATTWYIVIGVIIFVLIWVLEEVIGFILKRKIKSWKKFPKDAVKGIIFFIRFLAGLIILFGMLGYFGLFDQTTVLNFSTMFATAFGLAFTIAIGNLVAGFYLMITMLYHVDDFVKVGNIEGFVREIGLNFTVIEDAITHIFHKIPNKIAMNENLKIFEASKPPKKRISNDKDIIESFKEIKDELFEEKLARYSLNVEVELDKDPKQVLKILKQVMVNWKPKFGYEPEFKFDWIQFRTRIKIIITADEMEIIQSSLTEFLDDIWFKIYQKKEEGTR